MSKRIEALNRRQALAGIATAFAALSAGIVVHAQQPSMQAQPGPNPDDMRTSLHYEIDFNASPQRLYDAILDQKLFAAFSGMPATIDPAAGGAFSMFGGLIVGRNIELIANRRIVQAWRPTHWDPGIYSVAHFEFKPRAAESTLIFDHTAYPAGDHDHLDWGWQNHYWAPLRKLS